MNSRLCITTLWISFIALLVLGLVMVASTGLCAAMQPDESPETFIWKQSLFALLGIVFAVMIGSFDYHRLRNYAWLIYGVSVVLLILCYVPGFRVELNGEHRWINLGLRFQPSELAKICLVLIMAHWYTTHREMSGTFWRGFAIPGMLFGIPLLLILFEKDMGTAAALAMTGFCLMFVAGARWWLLVYSIIIGALVLISMTTANDNRMERIYAWLDPQAYSQGAGAQQWIAMLSFARGGSTGVGLGEGIYKYGKLPFAHTDFIFAAIGEEWGLVGTLGIVLLFTVMTTCGLIIALKMEETFGRLLATGLVCIIFWPAALNMMVVTSILPNTGLPLPFISYGGTNLIMTIAAIGLITSVQRHTPAIRSSYWPLRQLLNNTRP
ncbi:MAG TPA: putative lipid II flippase FtsW [Candidatus Akkermansia intestinigallinarum]|uniref:Probable peptidoglycan glycosyltransferase FtsW n=1 Tax=Candidatus Akkermansia intestinigallinarum TaxID=2838431 RepID=A0A9D1VD28_9BACT|nr:putative lipid II flippase FtsW [Candidatus Akkermansia intestinigallinarum]